MAAAAIVTCPSCGKKNRIGPSQNGIPRCAVCHTALPWIVEAGASDLDEHLNATVPVLVDFWAPWCGPCRAVTPVVDDFARTHAGELKVVKLNTDTAPEIANRFGVQGIPLLVVLRDGDEVDRLAGAAPRPHIERWLEQQLAAEAPTR